MPGYSTPEDHARGPETHADHDDHPAELARLDGAHADDHDEGDEPA